MISDLTYLQTEIAADSERKADRICLPSLLISRCVRVKQVEEGKKSFRNLLSVPSGFSSCCAYSPGCADTDVGTQVPPHPPIKSYFILLQYSFGFHFSYSPIQCRSNFDFTKMFTYLLHEYHRNGGHCPSSNVLLIYNMKYLVRLRKWPSLLQV